jgi:hypothetical protein
VPAAGTGESLGRCRYNSAGGRFLWNDFLVQNLNEVPVQQCPMIQVPVRVRYRTLLTYRYSYMYRLTWRHDVTVLLRTVQYDTVRDAMRTVCIVRTVRNVLCSL